MRALRDAAQAFADRDHQQLRPAGCVRGGEDQEPLRRETLRKPFHERGRVSDMLDHLHAGDEIELALQLGEVTGVDAAELIAVAREHAAARGLEVDYNTGELDELEGQFDLITCMEVIEHVADPEAFVDLLAKRLAPHGLLILSTPNATGWSKLLMIKIGEGIGRIPKGTHDFAKFIAPERMKVLLGEAGLRCVDVEGIAWSPTRGLHLSDDVRLNYLVAAVRA